jgi:N-acetylmuramoyl-L-alanine amidase
VQAYHTIQDGESLSSLALAYGLAPQTIWQDAANEKLRAQRSRADTLLVGDVVAIPDKRLKTETRSINARHCFRRIGVPILFELQLFDGDGQALAALGYTLEVDGVRHVGTTDDAGTLKQIIPNDARAGRIVIEGRVDRELQFGWLDPIETLAGVQKRLNNMGFACSHEGGQFGRATHVALVRFQSMAGLPGTGRLDDATREAVRACHDVPGHYETVLRRAAQSSGT